MDGLKLGIGLEMQEVEAGLKTLTSKVTNTSQQLEGLLSIAPHINSRDFEVGIKRMKEAHEQFVKAVNADIKIGWSKGKNSGSLRYDDLLGSRDRIEKSNSIIRDMLAGKVKTSFDKGKLTEIAQLQEAILKGANMATAAVDRETTSILKSIDAENKRIEKLKQSREARIESLNNQLAQTPLKTVKDLEKAVSLSKQVSAEMRKWNTADGNRRATENDKVTAELQKQLDIAKRNAKEKERVNGLVQKQNELLRKQGEADKNSIAGLTERYNLSKKILEVQRQLVGTSRYDKNLIAAQQKIADPSIERFNRKYAQHNEAYNAAVAANDFKAQLAALNSMKQMLLAQEVKSGMKFTNTAEITKQIEQTKQLKLANDEIENSKKKQKKADDDLINKEKVLLELEKRKSSTNGIKNKLARLTEERKKLNSLITGWQDYYRTAVRANNSAAQSAAQAKLAALDKEKAKLVDLIALEKNRIRSINQQKSLFNEQTSIFARLKSLAATYFSIYQVINFVKQIFNATKELQRQKVALEGIVGSAAKATETFNRLQKMAIESPFSLMYLTGWTKQLSAYGIAVDELLPTTHKLAELSAGLGVDMSRLILAYGQVNAAAVLRGQELRQFTEAGVPLVDKLADKFTELNGRLVTTGEVFELISKRQVSFEMVSEILTDMTSEGGKFYKMQESLMGTLYGQWEKVKDMWQIGLKEVGEATSGVFMRTITRIQKLIKNLPSLVKALGLALTIRMVNDVWRGISRWPLAIKQFNRGLQLAKARGIALSFTMRSVSKALTSNIIIAALSAIYFAFDALIRRAKEWQKTVNDINTSFAKDTSKLTSGLDKLIGKLQVAGSGTKAYADALETLKSNYGDYLNDNIISALLQEAEAAGDAADNWGRLAESIKDAIIQKQNYERLSALAEESIRVIVDDVKDSIFSGSVLDDYRFNTQGLADVVNEYYDSEGLRHESRTISDEKKGLIQNAVIDAVTVFLDDIKGGIIQGTEDELKTYLKSSALRNGFSQADAGLISDVYREVYDDMQDGAARKPFKQFMNSVNAMYSTLDHQVKTMFAAVKADVNTNYSSLIGNKNPIAAQSTYNPYGIDKKLQTGYINAMISLVEQQLTDEQLSALQSRTDYTNAIAIEEGKYEKGKAILSAITSYAESLNDPLLAANIRTITRNFEDFAGTFDQTTANIRTNASTLRGFENIVGGPLTDAEKDMVARYTKITEQNKESMRSNIKTERKRLEEEIESKDGRPNYTEEVKKLKRELRIIKVLASDTYYGIPEDENNRDRTPAESIPVELSDFLDKLKNAYERYKEATQKGGINAAVGYVKTDEQFKEMFGEFFGGAESEIFKNLNNLEVGDKTAMSLLQDKFIIEGLENGILDFEAAIIAVANELEDYATDTNGKIIQDRKAFANASKQLKQYIHKTFAKDNLAIMLDEFEIGLKKVTQTFEQTNKAIETYKKAIQNGTIGKVGGQLGITESQSLTPQSTLQEKYARDLIDSYNTLATSVGGESMYVTGDLSKTTDIYALIGQLQAITKMNNDNFGATIMGKPGEEVINALNKLADTIHNELGGISGEYLYPIKDKGDTTIAPAFMNLLKNTKSANYKLDEAQETSLKYGMIDSESIKTFLKANKDDAQAFFDAFMEDSKSDMFFDLFGGGIDVEKLEADFQAAIDRLKKKFEDNKIEFPATLEFELRQKKDEIVSRVGKLNAEAGQFGLKSDRKRYREADKKYQERYNELVGTQGWKKVNGEQVPFVQEGLITKTRDELESKQARFDILSNKQSLTAAESTELEKLKQELPLLVAQLKLYNDELTKIGQNGALAAQAEKAEALANMQTKLNNFSQGMTQMQDAVIAVVDSIKSATDMFAKFYDIVNDGENPKWLEIMQEGMNDFIENFKTAVAPILAVVAAIVAVIVVVNTLTTACAALQIAAWPLLVIMAALIVLAAIVAAVMTAIQAHDNRLQASIEDLEKEIKALDRAAKELNSTAERMVGLDKMKAQVDALGKSMSKATAAAENARLEDEKKNKDTDKVQDYEDASFEAEEEFKNGLKDMLDELMGAVEDWSDAMSDAIRSAFQNGENAARAFQSSVKEMIGDIVQRMLEIAILEPIIKGAIQDWTNQEVLSQKYFNKETNEFDEEGYLEELLANIKDPKKAQKFYTQMLGAGNALIDAVDNLSPELKDAYAFNSETSALSGGISGITEDTARQLEAIGNSQLIQLIQIKQLLETYAGGGIDKTHMAYVQTHLTLINNNVANIVKAISELRTTTVNPLHVTVI